MRSENFASQRRKIIIYTVIVGTFLVFVFRLFQMQIIQRETYEEKSADNSIKAVEQIPLRGIFYDRNGKVVVNNIPAYTIRITPAYYDKKLNRILETVLNEEDGYIDKILFNNKVYSKYVPVRIKRGIEFKVVAWLEENAEYLPGVDYIVDMQRGYPADIMCSHIFGYLKEITPQRLKIENEIYNPGDYVGNTGIEKEYESYLRGEKGYSYILVDSRQREIGKYKNGKENIPTVKGYDLVLSIDADVQRVAENELAQYRGAAVAIQPETGEVLALVSAPDYDLTEFSNVTSKEFLQKLYSDPEKPLYNRATMSARAPGSTFKILVAAAGLDMGVITPQTTFFCPGYFTYGRVFHCHGSHGRVNVVRAIEKSCNVFFYNVIFKIGLNNLERYANKFGFGKETGIDIRTESSGFIPTTKYYKEIYGENWPKSIMASLSIGQGEISVTPLQLAQYTALIANNGKTYKPHLVKGYLKNDTRKFVPFKFEQINSGIKKEVFDVIKHGMDLVVNGAGTATWIRMKEVRIAGKTGTAQNPHGKDHALFIAFAPYDDPKIAVSVLVENVGFGSTYAAPIAQKMIEAYLLKDRLKNNQNAIPDLDSKIIGAAIEN